MMQNKTIKKKIKEKRIRSRFEVVLDLTGRIAMIVGILWASFFCIQTFRKIGFGQKSESLVLDKSAKSEFESLENLLDGDWQFVGLPWSIQVTEFDGQFKPKALANTYTPTSFQPLRPIDEYDRTIWGLISLFQPTRADTSVCATYFIETQGWQVYCFAPLEQPEQIQIIRAQFGTDSDASKRVDLVREIDFPKRDEAFFSEPLVPMGAGGTLIALRRDSFGKVCAELFETSESDENLLRMWKETGWKVRNASSMQNLPLTREVLPLSQQTQASKPNEQIMVCNRGKDTICVVLSQFSSSGTRTLLSLRLSS